MARTVGTVNAPEFPQNKSWLNTDHPIQIKDLRGKVVLLDFWTYCCINCMHVLPDLKKLEHKYKDELVVIGVHSAKFTNERETENIRQAIMRYEIEHPVINDSDMQIWQSYAVRAWPTLYLIDPAGKVIGYFSGEGAFSAFDELIGKVIQEFDAKKMIDRKPVKFDLERDKSVGVRERSLLSFPGKILADVASKCLFISDSNHNRIVITSLEGEVQTIIGSGKQGLKDGSFEEAEFHHPQGMALVGNLLYIADTENHAIRQADLDQKTVKTLVGNGTQGEINSPWDLVIQGNDLYIAMAGPHQLWKMDLKNNKALPFAGSGREARIDGPLKQAALAQPSGLTTDGKKLYFADSEVSSIRSADLDPKGKVETIVGEDLFEFGDKDGKGSEVRLQHPLGVVYHNKLLYVADTYNHKIKVIDPIQKTSKALPISDLQEPAGLTFAGDQLYIADTNHHEIRIFDFKTKILKMLELKNMPTEVKNEYDFVSEQTAKSGKAILTLNLAFAEHFKLNTDGPTQVVLSSPNNEIRFKKSTWTKPTFPLKIDLELPTKDTVVQVQLSLYYCEKSDQSLCFFKEANVALPVKIASGGSSELTITYPVTANK